MQPAKMDDSMQDALLSLLDDGGADLAKMMGMFAFFVCVLFGFIACFIVPFSVCCLFALSFFFFCIFIRLVQKELLIFFFWYKFLSFL